MWKEMEVEHVKAKVRFVVVCTLLADNGQADDEPVKVATSAL